jgi:hypothetical protein
MLTTVDLLLTLGTKISDVVVLLLKGKANKQEQEEVQQLLKQYNQIKDSHLQVTYALNAYNTAVANSIVSRNLADLFQVCTHRGYEHAEQLHKYYIERQTNLRLEKIEILSVNLYTYSVEEMKFDVVTQNKNQRAQTYTLEKWTSIDSTGGRDTTEVINRYWLLLENEKWKVDNVEVFSTVNNN